MGGQSHHDDDAVAELLIQARTLKTEALQQPAATVPRAQTLAARASQHGMWQAAAIALNAQAWAQREMYQHDQAVAAADAAISASQLAGVADEQARALVIRSMIRLEQGDMTAAQLDLDSARELGHIDPELAFASSVVLDKRGRLESARTVLTDLVEDPQCPPDVLLKALNNLGSLLCDSDPHAALAMLARGAALATGGHGFLAAVIEHNTGVAQARLGRVPQALETFDRVRAGLLAVAGPAAEHDHEVARVLGGLRLLPEAREAAGRAVDALGVEGGALVRAEALLTAGRLAAADGDIDGARQLLQEAHGLFVEQQRPHGQAQTAVELAALTGSTGAPGPDGVDPDEVAAAAGAADLLAELGHHLEAARARLLAATLASAQGKDQQAGELWSAVEESPDLPDRSLRLEARARRLLSAGNGSAATDSVEEALDLIDDRCLLAGAADLRHRMSAARSRFEQLHRLAMADRPVSAQVDGILRTRPRVVGRDSWADPVVSQERRQWRQLAARLADPSTPPAAAATMHADLAAIERRLRQRSWTTGEHLVSARPAGLHTTTSTAAGAAVVLIVRIGDDAIGYRVDPHRPSAGRISGWSKLSTDLMLVRRALDRIATSDGQTQRRALVAVRRLLDHLDTLIRPLLGEETRVLLVVDRGLEGAAWAALPCLFDRTVSLACLAAPAVPDPDRAHRSDVVVGRGPGLDYALAEAATVAQAWNGHPVLSCSTAQEAVGALPRARVVHLAAHATLRWDNPLMSTIRLHDGPMAVGEILESGATPELLVLSCCSLGAPPADTALVGLIPLLLQGGVGGVVASTIALSDASAPVIADAVHTAVQAGESPASGLQRARHGVDPDDPAQTSLWAALGAVCAHVALP